MRNIAKRQVRRGEFKKLGKKSTIYSMIKEQRIEAEGRENFQEINLLRERLAQNEMELSKLREQLRYKNQQLASKDLEFECYKKMAEEKIIQLEAKIKELEAKIGKSRLFNLFK